MHQDKHFRTTNFYISCFLFSKGIELVNIEKDLSSPRSQFVFLDSPEREILTQKFKFAKEDSIEVMVDSRKFVMAIKMLKDKLYQGSY